MKYSRGRETIYRSRLLPIVTVISASGLIALMIASFFSSSWITDRAFAAKQGYTLVMPVSFNDSFNSVYFSKADKAKEISCSKIGVTVHCENSEVSYVVDVIGKTAFVQSSGRYTGNLVCSLSNNHLAEFVCADPRFPADKFLFAK